MLCDGYVPMLDDRGNTLIMVSCGSADMHTFLMSFLTRSPLPFPHGDNLMKGAVLYEAYAASAITIPAAATVAYIAGECYIGPRILSKP